CSVEVVTGKRVDVDDKLPAIRLHNDVVDCPSAEWYQSNQHLFQQDGPRARVAEAFNVQVRHMRQLVDHLKGGRKDHARPEVLVSRQLDVYLEQLSPAKLCRIKGPRGVDVGSVGK